MYLLFAFLRDASFGDCIFLILYFSAIIVAGYFCVLDLHFMLDAFMDILFLRDVLSIGKRRFMYCYYLKLTISTLKSAWSLKFSSADSISNKPCFSVEANSTNSADDESKSLSSHSLLVILNFPLTSFSSYFGPLSSTLLSLLSELRERTVSKDQTFGYV